MNGEKTKEERKAWAIVLTISKDEKYKKIADYFATQFGTNWWFKPMVERLRTLDEDELLIMIHAVKHMLNSDVAKKEFYLRLKQNNII